MDKALNFDDILILPNTPTYIRSRKEIDISGEIDLLKYQIPAIAPGMNSLFTPQLAENVIASGGLVIQPRGTDYATKTPRILNSSLDTAVEVAHKINQIGSGVLSIEIANGHMSALADTIKRVRDLYPHLPIWAGTVATPDGAEYLANAGATAVILGIGVGLSCTTTPITGVGYPMLQTILDCNNLDVKLISAGGLRKPADFVKAIAAGADLAMIGALLRGCEDTATPELYFGQASTKIKGDDSRYIEGRIIEQPKKGVSYLVLENLKDALRSAMSYVSARNLSEFRNKVAFAVI